MTKNLFISFFRLGLTAFGGPAMVAHIRELSVQHRQWLNDSDFKDGVALCQSIPGATAIQVAAYVGLRVNGIPGALAAYLGFGLPAFILMVVLSFFYTRFNDLPKFISLFSGLHVIVVAIILNAIFSFGRSIANNYRSIIIAIIAAVSFWSGVSPFIVIIGAALIGVIIYAPTPSPLTDSNKKGIQPNTMHILLFLSILLILTTGLYMTNLVLFSLATVMLKIDLFAFGGGFASVPLMLHEVVINRGVARQQDVHGWNSPRSGDPGTNRYNGCLCRLPRFWNSRCDNSHYCYIYALISHACLYGTVP
jgi:chromate transporter